MSHIQLETKNNPPNKIKTTAKDKISNINNINASKQSMKSSLPIPPENNSLFKSNNQSIQPLNSSLKKVDNIVNRNNNVLVYGGYKDINCLKLFNK